jgi:hypothetical protein
MRTNERPVGRTDGRTERRDKANSRNLMNARQYEFYAMYVRLTNSLETNICTKYLLPSIWLKLTDFAENLLPPPADHSHLTLLCPVMEGGSSSATSVQLYQTTVRHIPKYNIHIAFPRTSTTDNRLQGSGEGVVFSILCWWEHKKELCFSDEQVLIPGFIICSTDTFAYCWRPNGDIKVMGYIRTNLNLTGDIPMC